MSFLVRIAYNKHKPHGNALLLICYGEEQPLRYYKLPIIYYTSRGKFHFEKIGEISQLDETGFKDANTKTDLFYMSCDQKKTITIAIRKFRRSNKSSP